MHFEASDLVPAAPLPTGPFQARPAPTPAMTTSPSREGSTPTSNAPAPPLPPAASAQHNSLLHTDLQPPPSPRTHRALRRLQSAHTLGAKAASQANALIAPHYRDALHRNASPVRGSSSNAATIPTMPPRPPVVVVPAPQRSRGRANSDAVAPMMHTMNAPMRRPGAATKPVFSHGHLSLQQIIREGPTDGDFIGALESARWKVVDEGVKSAEDGMSTVRIYVWLVLLDAPIMPTDDYLGLIHRGASPAYAKIRNDTFRTLTTDPLFRRRVSEASLIRLLNAVAWKLHDAREAERQQQDPDAPLILQSRPGSSHSSRPTRESLTGGGGGSMSGAGGSRAGAPEPGTYVQGMNVLAAPFLYAARSEGEAFAAFHTLLTRECPAYIRGAMTGVHRGLALVDRVLAVVDPRLSLYLTAKGLAAEIYAFPSVLTLCACTPPLPEVLKLWDFLFAYGPHLNILCIVAQLTIMRAQILQSPSPNKVLRSFPPLNADLIKSVTIGIIKQIPDDIYADIVVHAQ
ncbi:mitotic check point protein (Bub2), putative [Cordyceps militaris CM01]|uniref:Mitotic check point protein (Bub2), putative n=1 Tax=Cordyceps militaris (strain CM01) TaxID=983644 RepID=G3JK23_CORMM|nr:mitotic check point protein (Bub2), putative [Cordyceps militaris CM01]EGX92153.1 mitotic check point protein (Bub2), putative [Cordyceps militaris CM01]